MGLVDKVIEAFSKIRNNVAAKTATCLLAGAFAFGGCKNKSPSNQGTGYRLVSLAGGDTVLQTTTQSPPAITSNPITAVRTGWNYDYTPTVNDLDTGDTITYSLTTNTDAAAIAAGLTIDTNTGQVTWPGATAGDYLVEIEAKDSFGLTDLQQYTLHASNQQFSIQGIVTDEQGNPIPGASIEFIPGYTADSGRGPGDPNNPAPLGTYFLTNFFGGLYDIQVDGGLPSIFFFRERTGLYAPTGGTLTKDFVVFSRNPINSQHADYTSIIGIQSMLLFFKKVSATDNTGARRLTTRWPDSTMPVAVYLDEAGLPPTTDNITYSSSTGITTGANGVNDSIDYCREAIDYINALTVQAKGASLFQESTTSLDSALDTGINVLWKTPGTMTVPSARAAFVIIRESANGMEYAEMELPDTATDQQTIMDIKHEFLHAAGLLGHSSDAGHVLNSNTTATGFTADEDRAIKTLYILPEKTNMDNYIDG